MQIIFNSENHTYTNSETNKVLISTTQLLRKHHLSPNYDNVNKDLLKRNAEHGTLVHKELEDFAKTGEKGITDEFEEFYEYLKANDIKIVESEWVVANDIVAGTIDVVILLNGQYYLCDYKTTSAKNIDSVSRQLSVYNNLQTKYNIAGLILFHLTGKGLVIDFVKEKPKQEVEKLFECERKGELYKQEIALTNTELAEIEQVENKIVQLKTQLELANKLKEDLIAKLVDIMEEQNIKKYESDTLTITYKAPYKKISVDTKLLKQENPDLVKKYEKETEVKASVLIKLKDNE